MALVVKNPPANAGDLRDAVLIPGLGISPGGGHGTHSSILAWRIPWTTISSSVIPFSSCLQSFPVLGSFPMSQFFAPHRACAPSSSVPHPCPAGRRLLRSYLRSQAQGEGTQGFLPQPEKDLKSPSSTRLDPRHAGFPRGEHRGSRHRFL